MIKLTLLLLNENGHRESDVFSTLDELSVFKSNLWIHFFSLSIEYLSYTQNTMMDTTSTHFTLTSFHRWETNYSALLKPSVLRLSQLFLSFFAITCVCSFASTACGAHKWMKGKVEIEKWSELKCEKQFSWKPSFIIEDWIVFLFLPSIHFSHPGIYFIYLLHTCSRAFDTNFSTSHSTLWMLADDFGNCFGWW